MAGISHQLTLDEPSTTSGILQREEILHYVDSLQPTNIYSYVSVESIFISENAVWNHMKPSLIGDDPTIMADVIVRGDWR